MKVVVHTSTHLKLLQRPWCLWVKGVLYELGCLYVWFRDSTPLKPLIVLAMLLGIGYLLTAQGGTLICDFYKSRDVMTRTRQGLLGRTTVEYPLQEITGIEVVERMNKGFIFSYKIRIILKSKILDLTADSLYTHGEANDIGNLIARFLDVPFNYLPTVR
jgi:hypothetical protein